MKISKLLMVTVAALFLLFNLSGAALGANEIATYISDDGIKVVSYSQSWNTTEKLKEIYDELYENEHGEEIKLLKEIVLLPGKNLENKSFTGEWKAELDQEDGKLALMDGAKINIYNSDELDNIEKIAPVLSHEYGHHFTYYYYFKYENKTWNDWRESELANAMGIQNHPMIEADNPDHMWSIQEIVADEYVQLFGSPTAKLSYKFTDITERVKNQFDRFYIYSIYNCFNFRPQENYQLPLAYNMENLKSYWQKASGFEEVNDFKVTKITPKITNVTLIHEDLPYNYKITWDKVPNIEEYTLLWFEKSEEGDIISYPVKTVSKDSSLSAEIGGIKYNTNFYYEELPKGVGYFMIYMLDDKRRITSSNILAVDFTNEYNPDTYIITDDMLLNGEIDSLKIKINGKQMNFDVPPVIENGRILVPMRAIFEELGATVNWDQTSQSIKAGKYDTNITLKIDDNVSYINGKEIILDVSPTIIDGRTMVPLRFIGEALGAEIKWNEKMKLVSVDEQ